MSLCALSGGFHYTALLLIFFGLRQFLGEGSLVLHAGRLRHCVQFTTSSQRLVEQGKDWAARKQHTSVYGYSWPRLRITIADLRVLRQLRDQSKFPSGH